jgi:spore coat polysaccharide biosynthesis protein SpsF
MDYMKVQSLVVLQARMSSRRLPGKVLMFINDKPLIYWQIKRVLKSTAINDLVVATSTDKSDDVLVEYLESVGIKTYRGSLNNVFSRFVEIEKNYMPDRIIRLTADCPLIMPDLIDKIVNLQKESDSDYCSNTIIPTFPDGLDTEVIKFGNFSKFKESDLTTEDLEHVTLVFHRNANKLKCINYFNKVDFSDYRWTVDNAKDLDFVRTIYGFFRGNEDMFTFEDLMEVLSKNELNERVPRASPVLNL